MISCFRPAVLFLSALIALSVPGWGSEQRVSSEIEFLLNETTAVGATNNVSTSLDATVLVPRFYKRRNFEPAWSNPKTVDGLFKMLNEGVAQGFLPADFHIPELRKLRKTVHLGGAEEKALFDVLATDAAAKLVHHLVFGKVDPAALDDDWNFSRPLIERDPAIVLNEYIDGLGYAALIERIDIKNAQYRMLVAALATYRTIARQGGWPQVPSDEILKPGMVEPAIAVLRKRLAIEGVLSVALDSKSEEFGVDPNWIYDEQLVEDVRTFQARHGLEADGIIGAKTFASLNRPVEDRVDMLRLSLERGRWLMRDLEENFVLVNIAGARTYLVKSSDILWTTRSITGSAYRKTPVFRDEIEYMEFNPTWTVPASIFRKDKLARIRQDPGYLSRNNYIVKNRKGQVISARSVNWSARNPSVTLVQKPGPDNALGLIKFMFPNKYAVYLHDTNDRGLFDRNERNLSSGCVRLEYPFEFAGLLMEGDPEWNYERMQSILESGKTTRVKLPRPIPVLLTYWTAWVEDGVVHFREDPYQRDASILAALDR